MVEQKPRTQAASALPPMPPRWPLHAPNQELVPARADLPVAFAVAPINPPEYLRHANPDFPDIMKALAPFVSNGKAPDGSLFCALLSPDRKQELIRIPAKNMKGLPDEKKTIALLFLFGLQARPQISGHIDDLRGYFEVPHGYALQVRGVNQFYPQDSEPVRPVSIAHVSDNGRAHEAVVAWGKANGYTLESLHYAL